jgi:SagB-type dehydrogenase family enzyme
VTGVTKVNPDRQNQTNPDLAAFLHNLHFDIDRVRPVDLEVDFDDAPLPYKLYMGLPEFQLPHVAIACSPNEDIARIDPKITLSQLGNIFWYSFGLAKISQTFSPFGITQSVRRFAPSGGALYPNELYAYLKVGELPHGIYHYNVARHSLVLLREGNFDDYIEQSLGRRCTLQNSFALIFISTVFWRNFFKYNNFSYRLQGIDAGVATGQLLEVVKRMSCFATVDYQFLDRAINHLIGITEEEESVYAIVRLSRESKLKTSPPQVSEGYDGHKLHGNERITSEALCRQIAPLQHEHFEKSRKIAPFPVIIRMNEAAMLHATDSFCSMSTSQVSNAVNAEPSVMGCLDKIPLPPVHPGVDAFLSACSNRYSPGLDFVLGKIELQQVATLLHDTVTSYIYENDIDMGDKGNSTKGTVIQQKNAQLNRISLAVCLHQIEGVPDGAYLYRPESHTLCLLQAGDHRYALQNGLSMQNVSLFQTPLCVHVIGDASHLSGALGLRGYRIQQMEVGMILQRLLLSASALGWNGHPFLGYDEAVCDEIYSLSVTGKTCLVQVPVGHYRTWSRLEGSLLR